MRDFVKTAIQPGEKLSEHELRPDELLVGQEPAYARDMERMLRRANEFVTVPCPACSSNACRPAFEQIGFHFQTCTVCETIYVSPRRPRRSLRITTPIPRPTPTGPSISFRPPRPRAGRRFTSPGWSGWSGCVSSTG